jgi:NUMOD4 motif
MTVEVWKSVVGLEGYYEVSNLGRVRSVDRVVEHKGAIGGRVRRKGQIMTNSFDRNGYLQVCIRKEGKAICPNKVHRLVAIAFTPQPREKAAGKPH